MFEALRRFGTSRTPSVPEALAALRQAYLLAFGGQLLAAVLVGAVLALSVGARPAGPLPARVLSVLAVLLVPLAPALARFAARAGGKAGALAGAIALGAVLATPGWLLMLAALLRSPAAYLFLMLAVLMLGYGLGFMLAGRFVGLAREAEE